MSDKRWKLEIIGDGTRRSAEILAATILQAASFIKEDAGFTIVGAAVLPDDSTLELSESDVQNALKDIAEENQVQNKENTDGPNT